jgi:hypothetical protein
MNVVVITCGTDKSFVLADAGHRKLERHQIVGIEALRLSSPPYKELHSMASIWPYLSLQMFTLRSSLFWDVTQCRLVVSYHCFRTTYQSHFQGSIGLLDPVRWDR